MTSSRRKHSGMSRRFLWLAAAIAGAIALYTFGWFYAADRLVTEANAAFERMSRGGNRASCESAEARGYPFRIGLFCRSLIVERRAEGWAANAGALRSAAQVYAPMRVVAELDSPARISLPRLLPLDVTWDTLLASTRLAAPLPERLSLAAGDIAVAADTPGEGNTGVLDAASAELHMRPSGGDLDVALSVDGLQIAEQMAGFQLPALAGTADFSVTDGANRIAARNFEPAGAGITIRHLELTVENGGTLVASGPLSVGQDGLLEADLELKASDAAALLAVLADAFPKMRSQMLTLGAGLSALGPDQALPLRIRQGVATLGFIELGRIPPL